jgi:hypothetical protein
MRIPQDQQAVAILMPTFQKNFVLADTVIDGGHDHETPRVSFCHVHRTQRKLPDRTSTTVTYIERYTILVNILSNRYAPTPKIIHGGQTFFEFSTDSQAITPQIYPTYKSAKVSGAKLGSLRELANTDGRLTEAPELSQATGSLRSRRMLEHQNHDVFDGSCVIRNHCGARIKQSVPTRRSTTGSTRSHQRRD